MATNNNVYYLVDKDSNTVILRISRNNSNKKVEIYNYKKKAFIEDEQLKSEIINPDYWQVDEEKAYFYIKKAKEKYNCKD